MKNINYGTVYQGSSPELIELYVLGYDIQWFSEGYWLDIPRYDDQDNYHTVHRVTNTKYQFRVKPKVSFIFFHTDDQFKVEDICAKITSVTSMVFSYPEYKPSGPYLMLKVDSKGKVLDSYSSTTKDVNHDDSFFKYC